ncbi:MAG TPA: hypothetical protein VG938_07015 [Verrucomicrobiae bacterium]|jgi:hypothetical protein|nr:hypothetical protein [Verrucomicrobiae bacterium]
MNPDSQNFDSLRQLLALKRHEIPPPGYFDRFSRDVMARIKAGERGGAIGSELSWFQRLLSAFDVKPVFAGAFGTAVCAFLISGVISSEQTPAIGSVAPNPGNTSLATAAVPVSMSAMDEQPFAAPSNSLAGSLFDQFQLETRPVSDRFYLPNGN